MFTKALSHRQKVMRLYKRCLRFCEDRYGSDALEVRYQMVKMRARFDAHRDEKDYRKAQLLLVDGFKQIWSKLHLQFSRFQYDIGGSAYDQDQLESPYSSSSDNSWEKLAIPPNEYDVLLTDINKAELEKIGIGEEIEYLSTGSFSSPAFPIQGIIYGPNNRLMICLVCQRANKPNTPIVNVWFFVDTGSPYTYLSEDAIDKLFGPGNALPEYLRIAIQNQNSVIECYTSHGRFAEVNLLGLNALLLLMLNIMDMNMVKRTFRLVNNNCRLPL